MTSGERMTFAASMAASADAGREATVAVKAATMAVKLLRLARDQARTAELEGVPERQRLTDEELAMLDDMLGTGADRVAT